MGKGNIEGIRRSYTRAEWRRIVSVGFSMPLPTARSDEDEISRIIDAQQLKPESATEARRIAREELKRLHAATERSQLAVRLDRHAT
jgi:hypothetical protein